MYPDIVYENQSIYIVTTIVCLFQVLLTILLMWGLCLVLTLTDHLPKGHPARTDIKIAIINDAPWFHLPYPGIYVLFFWLYKNH